MSVESRLAEAMEKHRAGDLEAAKTLYQNILATTPHDPDALNLLGVLFLQSRKLDEARQLIHKAIVINPTIAAYHFNLGMVLRQRGDTSAAIEHYRKCLEINPKMQIAREQLTSLGEITPFDTEKIDKPLYRCDVIQAVINRIDAKTYLEIGIDTGASFVNISADRKYGVDPVPNTDMINKLLTNCDISYFKYSSAGSNNTVEIALRATNLPSVDMPVDNSSEFYYETSNQFFARHAPLLFQETPVDVAFLDGLHTYHQTYLDIVNALDFISSGGIILIHDCNPPKAASAFPAPSWEEAEGMNIPGWDGLWCGDVWKSIVRLRTTRDDLRVFVLDCDFGIGVVCRGEPEGRLDITLPEIEKMTYLDLDKDKKRILNLKPQEYLFEFLDALEPPKDLRK